MLFTDTLSPGVFSSDPDITVLLSHVNILNSHIVNLDGTKSLLPSMGWTHPGC